MERIPYGKYTKEFRQEAVKLVIEGGLSIISTGDGWLYLAGHKDICTGEIVGYAMADRITKKPASQSLFRAAAKRPAKGLIHPEEAKAAGASIPCCL